MLRDVGKSSKGFFSKLTTWKTPGCPMTSERLSIVPSRAPFQVILAIKAVRQLALECGRNFKVGDHILFFESGIFTTANTVPFHRIQFTQGLTSYPPPRLDTDEVSTVCFLP